MSFRLSLHFESTAMRIVAFAAVITCCNKCPMDACWSIKKPCIAQYISATLINMLQVDLSLPN